LSNPDDPWFTGPLLTPSASVLSFGEGNLEPYLVCQVTTGRYNDDWKTSSVTPFYQFSPLLTYRIGIAKGVDIAGVIQSSCSWTKGVVGSSFGDLPIGISFQLFKLGSDEEVALGRFLIQEVFPTGRYQKLNLHKKGTDSGGQGSFTTIVGFVFSKQFKLKTDRFLRFRWFASTAYSAPLHVKGLNVYGGDRSTRGTEYPGQSFLFLTSGEYTITKKWTFSCDFQVQYSAKNRFHGQTVNSMVGPSSIEFSLAPAIEYNWDERIGIIIGPWFSLAGRNSKQFASLLAALNYNF